VAISHVLKRIIDEGIDYLHKRNCKKYHINLNEMTAPRDGYCYKSGGNK